MDSTSENEPFRKVSLDLKRNPQMTISKPNSLQRKVYQAVSDDGEGREVVHLLGEVHVSGVEDGWPDPGVDGDETVAQPDGVHRGCFRNLLPENRSFAWNHQLSYNYTERKMSQTYPSWKVAVANIFQGLKASSKRGKAISDLKTLIHLTWAAKLKMEKRAAAGSWIPIIRTNGHLP